MKKVHLIITSIAGGDSPVLAQYARECTTYNVEFIVIGDKKSPGHFDLDGCDFWSLKRQKELSFKLTELLPVGHYSRKNLGYLLAKKHGAQMIMETDDDNYPLESFWQKLDCSPKQVVREIKNTGWINVYRLFTEEKIWPRGFPLEKINDAVEEFAALSPAEVNCPIQQGLADENPDVDAVFRLTCSLPISFKQNIEVALGEKSWSPFNSQNTLWFEEAMPLMYLPSHCSFRMTDIWRSLVAQRIAWENGWGVLYYSPTVWQERNEHNLLRDFEDEVEGYLNNDKIVSALTGIKLTRGVEAIYDNLISCYDLMISEGWIGGEEGAMVRAWCEDLKSFC